MTTYVYETIPQTDDEVPVRFEVRQAMNDPKLTVHPESGKPVRRVICGGFFQSRAKHESVGSVTDPSWHERG
jgi:predicted nucleic acid-binding Zn ribbon protein